MSTIFRRPVVLTAVLTGAIALVQPVIGAAPAYAAGCGSVIGVANWSALQSAFATGGTVALDLPITEDEGASLANLLAVGSTPVTLDLAGCALSISDVAGGVAGIGVPDSSSLTIEDTVGGGSLVVTGGTGLTNQPGGAGIGSDGLAPSGSVTIAGAAVTATGGNGGASDGTGPGGDAGAGVGDGGSAVPDPSNTLTVSSGQLTATGGVGGAPSGSMDPGESGAGLGGGGLGLEEGSGSGPVVSVTGGSVTAVGGAGAGGAVEGFDGGAGIGGGGEGAGGEVDVSGGSVTATGGDGAAGELGGGGGAGIGGGGFGNGGTVDVTGGAVTATGGDGEAGLAGGPGGAGIGGGGNGDGGSLTVASSVTASGGVGGVGVDVLGEPGNDAGEGGEFYLDTQPPAFGSLAVSSAGTLIFPAATEEFVPDGASVQNDGTIEVLGTLDNEGVIDDTHGTLTGAGTVTNDGTILTGMTGVVADTAHSGTLTVADHNFDVTSFEFDGGTVPVSVPVDDYDPVDVFADSFNDAQVMLPPAPTPPSGSEMFAGWFTAASGGTRVFANSSLTHVLAADDNTTCTPCSQSLYAQYETITTPPGGGSGGGGGSTPPPSSTVKVTSSEDPSTSGDEVTFTATVSPVPTAGCGSVTWLIDNAAPPAGTATGTTGGSFTLGPVSSLAVGNHPVTAQFTGCATAGSGTGTAEQAVGAPGASPPPSPPPSSTVTDPTITAKVTSAHAKRHGWWRSPVHVTFTCAAGSAALASPCPDPVTVSKSQANQSVTASITAADGGSASVTVTGINIDQNDPTVHVTRHGHKLTCHGSDGLSGLDSCTIHRTKHTHNGVTTVHWTATATDNAGNTATKKGHFSYHVS